MRMLLIMGSAPLVMQKSAPTRDAAEKYVDSYLARAVAHTDANNLIYYIDASRNYDPSAQLDRITVPVMYINSADDFINPPELGIAEKLTKQMPRAQFILIPISDATRGHGTHTMGRFGKNISSNCSRNRNQIHSFNRVTNRLIAKISGHKSAGYRRP